MATKAINRQLVADINRRILLPVGILNLLCLICIVVCNAHLIIFTWNLGEINVYYYHYYYYYYLIIIIIIITIVIIVIIIIIIVIIIVFNSLADPDTYSNEKKEEHDNNRPQGRCFSYLPSHLNE